MAEIINSNIELSQYKTYNKTVEINENEADEANYGKETKYIDEYFGYFATVPRLYDVMCTVPLVEPIMTQTWTVYKNDGTTQFSTSTNSSIIVETGFKVKVNINCKWVHDDEHCDPEKLIFYENNVSKSQNNNLIPNHNYPYVGYNLQNNINDNSLPNIKITAKLFRIKTAPSVKNISGDNVLIKPNGIDELCTEASCNVSFQHRLFHGITSSKEPTGVIDDIKDIGLKTSKTLALKNITTVNGQYYCYMYPKSLGKLTKIVQGGATSIIDAFVLTEINITNAAGAVIPYYVYTTAHTGAFTGVDIDFS